MKVFSWETIFLSSKTISDTKLFFESGTALTVGSFDGPHKGHEKLFYDVLLYSKKNCLMPGVVTFTSSLSHVKTKENYEGNISTLEQRLEYFRRKGFSFVVLIDFSSKFATMKGYTFLKILHETFNMRFIAEGKDFHFGYKGLASQSDIVDFAKEYNVQTSILEFFVYENKRVSSSLIRKCIKNAKFNEVKNMLGFSYLLDCKSVLWKNDINSCVASKTSIEQVLPKNGKYKVLVNKSDCTKSAIISYLIMEDQSLRLGLLLDDMEKIRTIEFLSE